MNNFAVYFQSSQFDEAESLTEMKYKLVCISLTLKAIFQKYSLCGQNSYIVQIQKFFKVNQFQMKWP